MNLRRLHYVIGNSWKSHYLSGSSILSEEQRPSDVRTKGDWSETICPVLFMYIVSVRRLGCEESGCRGRGGGIVENGEDRQVGDTSDVKGSSRPKGQ